MGSCLAHVSAECWDKLIRKTPGLNLDVALCRTVSRGSCVQMGPTKAWESGWNKVGAAPSATRGQLPSLGLDKAAWPDQEENFKDAVASKEVAVKEGKGAYAGTVRVSISQE